MGVNIYILERVRVPLLIGGNGHEIGVIRRFFKITEIDDERNREIDAAAANAIPSPAAVMLAEVEDVRHLASGTQVKAHLLLGWDEGRSHVTDMDWEYLPVLGYAVRNPAGRFELHEERDGYLARVNGERAGALGMLGIDGSLVRRGQPAIIECREVSHYIKGYAQADCVLADGREEKLLINVRDGQLPDRTWVVGKRPMQIKKYSPS